MLGIADEHAQILVAACHGILNERHEVLILFEASVLKLVYHEVVEPCSHPLIDEWDPAVQHPGDEVVGVGEQQLVGVAAILLEVLIDAVEQCQQPQVGGELDQQLPGVPCGDHLLPPCHDFVDKSLFGHILLGEIVLDQFLFGEFTKPFGVFLATCQLVVWLHQLLHQPIAPQARAVDLVLVKQLLHEWRICLVANFIVVCKLDDALLECVDLFQVGQSFAVHLTSEIFIQLRHLLTEELLIHEFCKVEQSPIVLEEIPVLAIADLLPDVILHPALDIGQVVSTLMSPRIGTEREQEVVYSCLQS